MCDTCTHLQQDNLVAHGGFGAGAGGSVLPVRVCVPIWLGFVDVCFVFPLFLAISQMQLLISD